MGGPAKAAPRCCGGGQSFGCLHNGGWGDKSLGKVDDTFLKHFAIVSNTFHQLYPDTQRCLDVYLFYFILYHALSFYVLLYCQGKGHGFCQEELRSEI